MFVFGIGALAFALFLSWLAWQDIRGNRPETIKEWLTVSMLGVGLACVYAVAIRAFFQ